MIRSIQLPPQFTGDGFVFVVNMSGGKDSTAVALAMRAAGIPHRRVFADTHWEAPETYAYLDTLRGILGPIDVVGVPGGMPATIERGARFPSRMQRWCTRELKIEPLRAYCDTIEAEGVEAVSVIGVRGQESARRAAMAEIDDDREWGGWMWRPLLAWTVEDVIAIHHEHGVPLNPLYLRGHDRVGCFPCVMASKGDLRLLDQYGAERVQQIRDLEAGATAERKRRNVETPGRYAHEEATFFLTMQRARGGAMAIDDVIAWARTERGGRQLPLFGSTPDGGCFRWGVCDAPGSDEGGAP